MQIFIKYIGDWKEKNNQKYCYIQRHDGHLPKQ